MFLTRLIAGAATKVFLVVDHLSVPEAAAVDQGLADQTDRIEVFSLPKGAPERNPVEYLNCDLKANIKTEGLPKDREELHRETAPIHAETGETPRANRQRFRAQVDRGCCGARTDSNMILFVAGLIIHAEVVWPA
ncbi:MAG: transposase [Isosphaeraceae bacterium]